MSHIRCAPRAYIFLCTFYRTLGGFNRTAGCAMVHAAYASEHAEWLGWEIWHAALAALREK